MPASEYIKTHPAYRYASAIVSRDVSNLTLVPEVAAIYKPPSYVIKQCADFLKVADGEDPDFIISEHKCRQIDGLLKLLIMPRGLQFGKSLYDCTVSYQWLFYVAVLAEVSRKDPENDVTRGLFLKSAGRISRLIPSERCSSSYSLRSRPFHSSSASLLTERCPRKLKRPYKIRCLFRRSSITT